MKTGSWGIPLNYSIVVPILTLYEKHNIEKKGPNIRVQNKSTSVERC